MADSSEGRTLKILLQFLADTAGISQSKAAIQDLQRTIDSSKGGGLLTPIPKELLDSGPLKEAEVAAAGIAQQTAFAGVQMSKLRNEATTLAREIATGTVNMRTVSALFGSLGFELAAVGVAAFAVLAGINKWVNGIVDAAVEQEKFSDSLNTTVIQAYQIANLATKFEDVVKAEEHMLAPMDKLIDKLREAQKPVVGLKALIDSMLAGPSLSGTGPIAFGRQQESQKDQAEIQQMLVTARQARADAEQAIEAFKSQMDESVAQRIGEITQKLSQLTKEEAALDAESKKATTASQFAEIKAKLEANEKAQAEYNKRLEDAKGDLEDLTKSAAKMGDEISRADLSKLSPQEKIDALKKQIEDTTEKLKELGAESPQAAIQLLALGVVSKDDAKDLAELIAKLEQLRTELGHAEQAAAKDDARSARKDLLADLKEQENLIQHIRQQQDLTKSNEFLQPDEKAGQELRQSLQELQQLEVLKQKINADKLKPLDPAQLEQVNGKLQQTQFEIDKLHQKIQTLTFGGQLMTSLNQWTSSFGTAAQQIGHTIQGSINASLQQLNNLLITGKFNTQALIQSIAQMGLTLIEQLIEQRVMMAVNSAFATGQAAVSGPIVAAAWAPAATAVSVATEGEADAVGASAFATALAAVQGMVFAESGGLVGSNGPQLAMTGERGPEFVFSSPAVRNIGVRNLEAAHEAARGMGGGSVTGSAGGGGGGGGTHNHILVLDMAEAMKVAKNNRQASNHIIDLVRGSVRHLGV